MKKFFILAIISIICVFMTACDNSNKVSVSQGSIVSSSVISGENKSSNSGKLLNAISGESTTDYMVENNLSQDEKILDTKVNFIDNQFAAIGYIAPSDEDLFISKYFNSLEDFQKTRIYNFDTSAASELPTSDKICVIPKTNMVNISLYSCEFDENYQLKLKDEVISNVTEPVIFKLPSTEYIPKYAVVIEYNSVKKIIPVTFSGEDGSFIVDDENYVQKISTEIAE